MGNLYTNFKTGIDDLYHITVLKKEVVEALDVKLGEKYIDATLGGGGHGLEIVRLGGDVLGIDCDAEAIEYVTRRWKLEERSWQGRLKLVRGNFRNLASIAQENGFEKVAGIIFDLGTSRHQLKGQNRGFSFQKDEELDMRMDKEQELSAKEVISKASKRELYEIFTKLGEEKLAETIAGAIVRARGLKPIQTTGELAEIVRSVKKRESGMEAGTKVFQALRIYVNEELANLKSALEQTVGILAPRGRLAVISFHSLEDRIVKNFYKRQEKLGNLKIVTKKPIVPAEEEIKQNPSARSAKLRAAEKTGQD